MKLGLMQDSQKNKFDDLFTPSEAVYPIVPHIPEGAVVWEPFDPGKSGISKVLRDYMGFEVISSDIRTGHNFLKDDPLPCDLIVSNPPYSQKDKVLKRAYEIGKPFAFLLPLTALEGQRRSALYRKYGVQILVLDRRFDFSGGGGNWFNTSYFCWNMLPTDLMFVECKEQSK